MSEEINLESNNLCTSEDAFEQFQANSMFEEDEYITLADIVPPQPEAPDLTSDLNEVPYSNEVVLTSSHENDSQDVNSTAESYSDEKNVVETAISNTRDNNRNIELPDVATEESKRHIIIKSKGRGRKRKYFHESNVQLTSKSTENLGTQECHNGTQENTETTQDCQSLIQDSVLSTTHGKKRGRPKKSEHKEKAPILPRRTHRERIPNTLKYPVPSESENSDALVNKVNKTSGKRGRPKKVSHENQNSFEADSTNFDHVSSIDRVIYTENTTFDDTSSCKKEVGRRGRPKKVPIVENQVHTQHVSDTSSSNSHNLENVTMDSSLTDLGKKLLGITARQRKLHKELPFTALEVSEQTTGDNFMSIEISQTEDDEMDNISLSNLSKKGKQSQSTNEVTPVADFDLQTEYLKEVNPDTTDSNNISLDKSKVLITKFDNTKSSKQVKQKIIPTEPLNNTLENTHYVHPTTHEDDDDGDDICLSKLKETIEPTEITEDIESTISNIDTDPQPQLSNTDENKIVISETNNKRNSKMPIMSDFEYNIDSIIQESVSEEVNDELKTDNNDSLLIEDTSKRPIRRKVKQTLHYDEGSDEDPFANVELSDDDEPKKKGTRYYSDDEYIPGKKRGKLSCSSSYDSDLKDELDELIKQKRKKTRKRSDNQSPRKRGKKCEMENVSNTTNVSLDVTTIKPGKDCEQVDDIEVCLQSSVIKASDESVQNKPLHAWGVSNEFENFLAKKIQGTNLKIKKLKENTDSSVTPLEIPVINTNEAKKTYEMSSQTSVKTDSIGVQTSTPYDLVMKRNTVLTPEQSHKACKFLNSVVKTTAELGQLMTQKSEDFIKKKINTANVTDTLKMDYCVRKSFLLFKLAKHNLLQMEEDLAKQYERFLTMNKLLSCTEEPKKLAPKLKTDGNDSDCEIVEVSASTSKHKEKPKFNPKTVFLNKELSIKIAKKPTDDKKLNIKGRHTVWINDSVMVKKVTPTQSFLAQDSRNKKPPDNFISEKMVSDFFKDYYRRKADYICAPYTSTDWLNVDRDYICNYFVVKSNDFAGANVSQGGECSVETNVTASDTDCDFSVIKSIDKIPENYCPKRLSTLCTELLQNHLYLSKSNNEKASDYICNNITDGRKEPVTLLRLCVNALNCKENEMPNKRVDCREILYNNKASTKNKTVTLFPLNVNALSNDVLDKAPKNYSPKSLITFSTELLQNHLYLSKSNEEKVSDYKCDNITDGKKEPATLLRLCVNALTCKENKMPNAGHKEILYNASASTKTDKKVPVTLFRLCVNALSNNVLNMPKNMLPTLEETLFETPSPIKVKPLKTLCHTKIVELLSVPKLCINIIGTMEKYKVSDSETPVNTHTGSTFVYKNRIRSLFSLCTELIQSKQKMLNTSSISINTKPLTYAYTPSSLKDIAYKNVKQIMYGNSFRDAYENAISEISYSHHNIDTLRRTNELAEDSFKINHINTMSEEAFLNLVESLDAHENSEYLEELEDEDCYNDNEFTNDSNNFEEDNQAEETNWASQVQLNELKSCFISSSAIQEKDQVCLEGGPSITQIKLEPLEEISENMISLVKTEPVHNLDEMCMIPGDIVAKSEIMESPNITVGPIQNVNYAADSFEDFARNNKMISALIEYNTDDIFRQSGLRIRRQHEPDFDEENDTSMSLLVPQTYEPLRIETAKGSLMESSSDEGTSNRKTLGKKKTEKRRGRPKKSDTKTNNKEITTKEKPVLTNEVAVLTRRMRERIRQEEKKIKSSDSEDENIALNLRRDKTNKKESIDKQKSSKSNKTVDDEIQCNNVDSTEQVSEYVNKNMSPTDIEEAVSFTGFSAIDQNEISSYQKYMKYVYDKIIPKDVTEESIRDQPAIENSHVTSGLIPETNDRSSSLAIDPNLPVELLECEPLMPIFEDECIEKSMQKSGDAEKTSKTEKKKENSKSRVEIDKATCIERHGWKCYPIDTKDSKLYQDAQIVLEKLPESFVVTYFRYQDVTDKAREDEEVDRLINLQSLKRISNVKDSKEIKSSGEQKSRANDGQRQSGQNSHDESRTASAANSDFYDELTPSEDEGANADDEIPPPVPMRTSENCLAKNSLMDDNDSDPDNVAAKKIKEEPKDDADISGTTKRPGPKSRTKHDDKTPENSESLMLTADKMMNKELTLLHAPIVLNDEVKETPSKTSSQGTRLKQKSATKSNPTRYRTKADDDSSSEEEKQWVSTKEKLLKRMGRKEDASVDDAKRAKLVSEFIERRGDAPEARTRRGKGRRSNKKLLERQKQLRVLSKELFGESPFDASHTGKRSAQAYFKGRRNIRKVIDKKSLTKSTVVANMEEFERKRRLNMRQNRLRELLGCEEGVNVLVINDEVCLEYDFHRQRPVVTVHPFFTKVMKAHQYEGVKFMWDACFESLSTVEAGHPGGGCILAHCMGLGKTLQVLALLHTVLTHPRVGMQRVLVCCPLSTVLNWVDEIHKWIGPVTDQIKPRKLRRKLQVFELSKLRKTYERAYQLEDWYSGGGIFIIGYELFRSLTTLDPLIDDIRPTIVNKIRTALLDPGPDIIVCDEGHLLKNDCSVLAVAMSRVVTKRRIVLTGTPMQNNLREYYCMVNFVKPNLLGTYAEYSNRFENPIMNGQHRDSREEDIKLMKARTHILHKVLEGCLQRQEASVLYPYLPKKHEYTVFISLTKCQWDLYKHYLHNYGKQSKQSILKDFHILQKIWSHPQVLHNFQMKSRDETRRKVKAEKNMEDDLAHEDLISEDIKPPDTEVWWLQYLDGGNMLDSLNSSNKFVAVFRILDECIALDDKVLIFSTSLFCLDALEFFLKKINKWSLGQEYYRLDGSVPAEVRQKWCREFNADNNHNTKLFLISTRAGCLGLNMTAANRVIILDTSWNPAHDIQSIFRVYRFGQKKDCYIYRLVAMGTMEQKIYERSVTKQAVACRVVDEQQIDRHYNMAELTELYRVDDAGLSVPGGVAVGVEDVALLRVARDAALHAVHEHDSLLRGSSEQNLPEHERAAAWMQFQQEHAHKQMQNDLDANRAEKALKLQHDRETARHTKIIKIENKNDEEYILPSEPKIDLKSKRGRKPTVVNCRLPIQSDAEQAGSSSHDPEADQRNDDAIVRKITDILLKYNFQSRQGANDISELMTNVRRMVATGQPMPIMPGTNDELTKSIANVLLERDRVATPALTDIMCESLTNSVAIGVKGPARRRGRPRKDALQNVSAEAPENNTVVEMETGGRKKRRAALAAEKHFDSLSQDSIIELDDEEWRGESDTDTPPKHETITDKPKDTKKKNISKTQKVTKDQPLSQEIRAIDSSILLSDDDETVVPPQPQASKDVQKDTVTDKEVVQNEMEDKEVTPLHPSLLTNKNFIKIVAHTYLTGNPMLDEDAATLAAQYSTYKALKEIEATGKSMDSGPIYDIAVKVLGIEILNKLHKTNATLSEPAAAKSISVTITDKADAPKALAEPNTIVVRKVQPRPPPPRPPHAADVVPVGLIKRAVNIPTNAIAQPARDECILPDDDEVRIIADSPPESEPSYAPVPAPAPAELLNRIGRRKSKPLVINNVVSSGHDTSAPAPAPHPPANAASRPIIKIGSGRIITVGSNTPPNGVNTLAAVNSATSRDTNDTICLDSDDEDAMTPRAQVPIPQLGVGGPQLVPVSLVCGPGLAALDPHVVPISLSGPGSQPVPISLSGPGSHPVPVSLSGPGSNLVPVSLSGPGSNLVPVSLSGPGSNLVPVSLSGPGSRLIPVCLSGPGPQLVPVSLSGPGSRLVPVSLSGPGSRLIPVSLSGPGSRLVPVSLSGPGSNSVSVSQSSGLGSQSVVLSGPGSPVVPVSLTAVRPHGRHGPVTVPLPGPGKVRINQNRVVPVGKMIKIPASAIPHCVPIRPAVPSSQRLPDVDLTSPPSETVAPTPPSNPAPAGSLNKTICKPGDILRITKTGNVEILTRQEETLASQGQILNTSISAPGAAADKVVKSVANRNSVQNINKPVEKQPVTLAEGTSRASKERPRSVSSVSSSSSASSRSPSPADPLDILKDVVHIQAYDTPNRSKSNVSKLKSVSSSSTKNSPSVYIKNKPDPREQTMVGKSIKKTAQHITTNQQNKTRPPRAPSDDSKPITSYKDKAEKQVDKTNTIIQKLQHLLAPVNKDRNSTTPITTSKNMVDLTKTIKANLKPDSPAKTIKKFSTKTQEKKKEIPSTVVGTSKNIIFDGKSKTLKTTSPSVDLTRQNSINITNVKTLPQRAPAQADKKRPSTSTDTSVIKKKKTEQMTLKDFDIDDIDDIIELD